MKIKLAKATFTRGKIQGKTKSEIERAYNTVIS